MIGNVKAFKFAPEFGKLDARIDLSNFQNAISCR